MAFIYGGELCRSEFCFEFLFVICCCCCLSLAAVLPVFCDIIFPALRFRLRLIAPFRSLISSLISSLKTLAQRNKEKRSNHVDHQRPCSNSYHHPHWIPRIRQDDTPPVASPSAPCWLQALSSQKRIWRCCGRFAVGGSKLNYRSG